MTIQARKPLYDTFSRISLGFERGDGAWLITEKGDKYLDFTSGIAVNALGYGHPYLIKALKDQVDRLWHVSNLFENPLQIKLALRLTALSFADKVFFTNSGAEAIECALKTARRYHYMNGHPERFRIITFEGAFHGRTLATLAAGGNPNSFEGLGPKLEGFHQVSFFDKSALLSEINEETAAIMIEPIQGEGGVRLVSHELLRFLRDLCNQKGLLLIFDEVQCGIGRTGELFAYEWAGVSPDIMGIAKAIGGGFPLGACLATAEAAKGMTVGTHGSTFGGNPLAMVVGNAVLDIILEDGFLDRVKKMAYILENGLSQVVSRYPSIVNGMEGFGLLVGLKCAISSAEVISAMRNVNLLAVGASRNIVRLLPPLNILEDDLYEGLSRIEKAIAHLAKKIL
ncbi:MAG: acetylornithine/N-succinyldiaminopimelate aminotransferase [Candidatus Tokpelaia sp. JSC161]|jgi:acetylornithine/N-succinyldiaminopimelate aminotransferase|nr:MAG: acetylornithine/N-succinyldiaminopimelate aminotransferase [Candidatus Tokpelaia sp. JSC161]